MAVYDHHVNGVHLRLPLVVPPQALPHAPPVQRQLLRLHRVAEAREAAQGRVGG